MQLPHKPIVLRPGAKLGKYKVVRRLARGGFADVYRARDTVEGVPVALKVPFYAEEDPELVVDFRREARVAAQLSHPNVLPLKNADLIAGKLVIAYALGRESLADRLSRRVTARAAFDWGEQLLAALAFAHERRVIHCDVKPENMILFEDGTLRLADFGLAKVAAKTISGSASGTVEYMAPEQALGRPSARSDVFSAGLVIYKMFTGALPAWPFEWPLPRHDRLPTELRPVLQRALAVDARKRHRDAAQLLRAFRKAKRTWLGRTQIPAPSRKPTNWRSVRLRQLRRRFGSRLELRHRCGACDQPVDERMQVCPWCAAEPLSPLGESRFPACCPRCERGVKLDWKYCAWCHGAAIGPSSTRSYSDRAYSHKCGSCKGRLLPFSRYCPWCRARVRRRWSLGEHARPCRRCDQPVSADFWSACPWCGTSVKGSQR